MDSFTYLFSHFFWLIFPVFGMGMGAFAIWTEHRRQVKGLELLRTYAEQGKEPPQAVLDALPRIAESRRANRTRQSYGASFVLMLVLSVGFAGAALASYLMIGSDSAWVFVIGFGITSFVLVAVALQNLVMAIATPPSNEP
jgi:hypothetical protein